MKHNSIPKQIEIITMDNKNDTKAKIDILETKIIQKKEIKDTKRIIEISNLNLKIKKSLTLLSKTYPLDTEGKLKKMRTTPSMTEKDYFRDQQVAV